MKYRIKKITNAAGNVEYIPQKKFLYFFWKNLMPYSRGWPYIEDAKDNIHRDVYDDLKRKLQKIEKTEYIQYP